ncbi:MAG TPA: hypothetical protein VL049_11590 [Candidatus Dormibacteraeota bacterium]|nr:hypothetical protein [Candidatus Dormibacteraeota bacterium]
MFVLARTITYATLFVGFLLVFLPARILDWFGLRAPTDIGLLQYAGVLPTAAGSWSSTTTGKPPEGTTDYTDFTDGDP